MFTARIRTAAARATTTPTAFSHQQAVVMVDATRNMATLKEIQMRLKSVSNISKITKSMKMIAATKMTKAQRLMETARVYGEASNSFVETLYPERPAVTNSIAVACSSDRGLCGGIHSSVSKAVKKYVRENPSSQVVIIGQKAKPQIAREARSQIVVTYDNVSKVQPTWDEAALIADSFLKAQVPFDALSVFYNRFKSVIAFETTSIPVFSYETLKKSDKLAAYEYDSEVLKDYAQFATANTIYAALTEGNASEMAAKRTAMENATKNAGDMITKLTLTFNRSRQAVITNELCDIITGASAL